MFGGSQVQKSYRASANDFWPFNPDIMIRYVVDMGENLGKYSRNPDKMGEIIENRKNTQQEESKPGETRKNSPNNPQGESEPGKSGENN